MAKADRKTASKAKRHREPFGFEDGLVRAGSTQLFDVKVSRLPAGSWATMPTVILHGLRPGPTVFLSGAIHGDELNGIETVRRVLKDLDPGRMAGTIIAVPIVNIFGVTIESRYLPDRRDLNRSFPGSKRGSLASRLAHLFFERVASRCDLGIDFHTGSNGRSNLPQVRCDLDDEETRRYAHTFAAPLVLHSALRDGSLRAAAGQVGIRVLIYEAGEASRFSEHGIRVGVNGTLRVLHSLGMIDDQPAAPVHEPRSARSSKWTRASRSGFCQMVANLGQEVRRGDTLAVVTDNLGKREMPIKASRSGIVIGALQTALVHRGDALVHIAEVSP